MTTLGINETSGYHTYTLVTIIKDNILDSHKYILTFSDITNQGLGYRFPNVVVNSKLKRIYTA